MEKFRKSSPHESSGRKKNRQRSYPAYNNVPKQRNRFGTPARIKKRKRSGKETRCRTLQRTNWINSVENPTSHRYFRHPGLVASPASSPCSPGRLCIKSRSSPLFSLTSSSASHAPDFEHQLGGMRLALVVV
jgi:hypothetical protein